MVSGWPFKLSTLSDTTPSPLLRRTGLRQRERYFDVAYLGSCPNVHTWTTTPNQQRGCDCCCQWFHRPDSCETLTDRLEPSNTN